MTDQPPRKSRKRRLLDTLHLLISHHDPPYMHRTWSITFRGHTLHICARCSALLVGIILALYIHIVVIYIPLNPLTFFGAFLLSLPAVVDWSTQTLQMREGRNPIRALTGFLLGYAVGFVLSSFNVIYYLLVVVLYSGYTLGFGAIAPRIIRWRAHRHALREDNPPPLPIKASSVDSENPVRDEEENLI
ncbi:MAG: DUF2085 domain-containing protein [Promethearchaeota archaeon]